MTRRKAKPPTETKNPLRCDDCGMTTPPSATRRLHHVGCGAGAPELAPQPAETAPTEPEPAEPGYRTTMHLGLDAIDIANLEKIIAMMRRDPKIGRLHAKLGREKAARYAIAHCVEHPPAHVTTG